MYRTGTISLSERSLQVLIFLRVVIPVQSDVHFGNTEKIKDSQEKITTRLSVSFSKICPSSAASYLTVQESLSKALCPALCRE